MFEEDLINAIEVHRCIWDRSQLSYRDKNEKYLAWRDVSALVGESEADCRKRWKSLRDRFSIELKQHQQPRGSASSFRKWAYFDAMCFLKGNITDRKSTTNIKTEIETESSFSFELNKSGELVLNDQTEESEPVSTKRKKRKEDEESSCNSLVEDVSGFVKSRKTYVHDNFLGAIGDIFEKVPPEQLLDFKMDVLQYVYTKFKSLSAN